MWWVGISERNIISTACFACEQHLWTLKSAVLALKSLQKSMIFKPACPSAGPTGGVGFACPAFMVRRITCLIAFFVDIGLYFKE